MQRTESRGYVIRVVVFALLCGACLSACPPACEHGTLVSVPAAPQNWSDDVFTPTSMQVTAGDRLSFAASGRWDVGLGQVGPDGREDWCECPVRERRETGSRGRLGALIGRIGTGEPFLIGSQQTITAKESGSLFLTANDNMGPCDGDSRGSCYQDNTHSVWVCVRIT